MIYNNIIFCKAVILVTELEKIEYTKEFIDKLASGVNPLDDTPVPDGDLLNNVRISRCMYYVSEILGQVIRGGFSKRSNDRGKVPFSVSSEQLMQFPFSQEPIGVTEINNGINSLIDENTMKKLKVTSITEWLVDVDLLYNEVRADGKRNKRATARGMSLGISEMVYQGQYGEYKKLLYDENAQRFIIDNLDAIVEKNNS